MSVEERGQNKGRKGLFLRWVGRICGTVFALAALVSLFLILIIAQPQKEPEGAKPSQPPLEASPEVHTDGDAEGRLQLAQSFPTAIMTMMSGSGYTFVSGEARDVPCQDGIARVSTEYWQTAEGVPMILQSIYPADALELIGKGDYSFSEKAGPVLLGAASVRMEDAETVRLHVQGSGQGLYALTVPKSLEGTLSEIVRSIQLFTTHKP